MYQMKEGWSVGRKKMFLPSSWMSSSQEVFWKLWSERRLVESADQKRRELQQQNPPRVAQCETSTGVGRSLGPLTWTACSKRLVWSGPFGSFEPGWHNCVPAFLVKS